MDVYESRDLPADAPLFVFIHGGYWQEGSRASNTFMVEPLVNAGIRVCLIGYDLCPSITLSELYEEVQLALSNILKTADKRGDGRQRVILCGHSAGACLALAMLAKDRWEKLANQHLICSVVLLGGIYDLSEAQYADTVNKNNLLGLNKDTVKKLSPLNEDYSHLGNVHVTIVVGEWDAPGLGQQGRKLQEKLEKEKVQVELLTAREFDHFDLVTELRDAGCWLTQRVIKECQVK